MINIGNPWNNKLNTDSLHIKKLCNVDFDKNKQYVLGVKIPLEKMPKDKTVVFVGTDVSGKLHLGHVVLLSLAELVSEKFQKKLIVSLNELESVFSRKNDVKFITKNSRQISQEIEKNNGLVHSRVKDHNLILFSILIWKYLIKEKNNSSLFKLYNKKPNSFDLFSVAIMAATPLSLCLDKKKNTVLAVYGEDEVAHLELIYKLYKSFWFKKEVLKNFDIIPPAINYLIVKLLPDITGKYKMSKSRPKTTIFIDSLQKKVHIKFIINYLQNFKKLLKDTQENLEHNKWYSLINFFLSQYE